MIGDHPLDGPSAVEVVVLDVLLAQLHDEGSARPITAHALISHLSGRYRPEAVLDAATVGLHRRGWVRLGSDGGHVTIKLGPQWLGDLGVA